MNHEELFLISSDAFSLFQPDEAKNFPKKSDSFCCCCCYCITYYFEAEKRRIPFFSRLLSSLLLF